jgi:PPOX class probable F420-dependent enzyme
VTRRTSHTRGPVVSRGEATLARSRFVLLTTRRVSGRTVATPVWIVADPLDAAGGLAVLTNADTGKVRRVTACPDVELVPCDPGGSVKPGTTVVGATARVLTDEASVNRIWRAIRRKYPVEHAVLRVLGMVRPAWRRWDEDQVVLAIRLK